MSRKVGGGNYCYRPGHSCVYAANSSLGGGGGRALPEGAKGREKVVFKRNFSACFLKNTGQFLGNCGVLMSPL